MKPKHDSLHSFGIYRLCIGLSLRFCGIENPVCEQFNVVIDKEPQQNITPHEPGPDPAEGRHEQPVNRYQRRYNLRAYHLEKYAASRESIISIFFIQKRFDTVF